MKYKFRLDDLGNPSVEGKKEFNNYYSKNIQNYKMVLDGDEYTNWKLLKVFKEIGIKIPYYEIEAGISDNYLYLIRDRFERRAWCMIRDDQVDGHFPSTIPIKPTTWLGMFASKDTNYQAAWRLHQATKALKSGDKPIYAVDLRSFQGNARKERAKRVLNIFYSLGYKWPDTNQNCLTASWLFMNRNKLISYMDKDYSAPQWETGIKIPCDEFINKYKYADAISHSDQFEEAKKSYLADEDMCRRDNLPPSDREREYILSHSKLNVPSPRTKPIVLNLNENLMSYRIGGDII